MFKISMVILLPFLLFACHQSQPRESLNQEPANLKEELIEANKGTVKTEDQHIEDFINRRGWKMQTSGTGLRYMITTRGNGKRAVNGDIAVLEYKTRLITGEVIYSSDNDGLKEFEVGHGGVEAGLEEAVSMMQIGDKGYFILPSYIAWGLSGDGQLIPPKSTLIYELKLIDLK